MNAVGLMYHDVTPAGREDSSGFPGGDAARYKIPLDRFAAHLRAIRARLQGRPCTIDTLASTRPGSLPLFITFDDGGVSAREAADCLDVFGWRGHFFITTAYIDRPGFLTAAQIRELHARGHVIGSHSCTHPLRMARCSPSRLQEEWRRSVATLSDIVRQPIVVASVPGGDYAPPVGDAAQAAGIRYLFTSRPTIAVHRHGDLLVAGRYAVRRSTTPARAAAVACGAARARLPQLLFWDAKALGKATAGAAYLRLRDRILGRSASVRWGDELVHASDDPTERRLA